MPSRCVTATFADPQRLVTAVRALRERGFTVRDVYAPYPLHGLDQALGLRRSRLGIVTFLSGLAGALAAVGLQVGTAVVDWPLNVGGKPANSALAFLPITFELTVLFAGLATAAAFLVRSRLFPGAKARPPVAAVTEDTFALVADGGSLAEAMEEMLLVCGAQTVHTEEAA